MVDFVMDNRIMLLQLDWIRIREGKYIMKKDEGEKILRARGCHLLYSASGVLTIFFILERKSKAFDRFIL